MIEINGKVYRNIQEQVQENMDDIEDLDERVTALEESPTTDYYTKAESDAKYQTKTAMSDYYTKTAADNKFQTQSGMSTYATKEYVDNIVGNIETLLATI